MRLSRLFRRPARPDPLATGERKPPRGRSRRWSILLAGALLLAGILETGAAAFAADPSQSGKEAEVVFDAATTEDLALFFATESVQRLRIPLAMRLLNHGKNRWSRKDEIERIRANPPRIDDQGVVYPFGDKNPLSFVLDDSSGTLTCWERIVKKRGSVGLLSLTGPELATALNEVSSRDRDRGGADFGYDPIRDALSLRLAFMHPPSDREDFYHRVDRLVKTAKRWIEGRYLEEAKAITESRQPPRSATVSEDGFEATLVLRHFSAPPNESRQWVERYLEAWDRPHGGPAPMLVSDRELLVDQTLHAFIHFRGAENEAQGGCSVVGTFSLVAPGGSQVFTGLEASVWRGEVPPADHLQLGETDFNFALDADNPPGSYRLMAEVCESGRQRCVALAHPIQLQSR